MNHYLIITFLVIIILYKLYTKKKDKSYPMDNNTIYVMLRVKDNNMENTETFLRSFQKQNLKNKKLIIMNDKKEFDKYFMVYCELNDNTDLYSTNKLDESKFNLIINDIKMKQNQIVLTADNDDYFDDSNLLSLISENKINSFRDSKLRENQPKYYHFQKK
jgi:hypothetical protein